MLFSCSSPEMTVNQGLRYMVHLSFTYCAGTALKTGVIRDGGWGMTWTINLQSRTTDHGTTGLKVSAISQKLV